MFSPLLWMLRALAISYGTDLALAVKQEIQGSFEMNLKSLTIFFRALRITVHPTQNSREVCNVSINDRLSMFNRSHSFLS
jgi:hypothetical protein